MKNEVLLHRQFRVEGEGLRHVADAPTRTDITRIDFMAQQPCLALRGRQQAGEHFHGRGFAAAVGAKEPEDLAAPDAQIHPLHGSEVAETHGQPPCFDGGHILLGGGEAGNHHRLVETPFFLRQQGDEGGIQGIRRGACAQFGGSAGGQHLARIHGHQPVEAICLLHVSRRHNHAHPRPFPADAVHEAPELAAREWINPCGRFVENEQVRVVDERAADAQLLFHAAG